MKRKSPKSCKKNPKIPDKFAYKGEIPAAERLAYCTHLKLVAIHILLEHILNTNSVEVVNPKLIRKIKTHIQKESDRIYNTIGANDD